MSSGLDLALGVVGRVRGSGPATRIVLISDGHANEGDSSLEGLTGRAARAARDEVVLSAVGEHFNELLLSAVADAGTGNYYYLQDTRELAAIFAQEFTATRHTVALAIWSFFLAPSLCFLIGGMGKRPSEGLPGDPFERARQQAMALMDEPIR
jgi:Ca-activated chloride channel family protein